MPFKSKAQRRKFAQLLVEGKISDETFEEWSRLIDLHFAPRPPVR
jgi:3-deoxy-D-manno-octulosonic-acid transferase